MSTYATPADLALYGLPAAALVGIDPTTQQQPALDAASAEADTYLRNKFTLPLIAPYPKDLVKYVCKIAAWELLAVRGFNPESGSDVAVRTGYKDAVNWLEKVSRGDITPAITDSAQSPVSTGGPFVLQPQVSDTLTDANGNPALVSGAPTARGW